MIGPIKIDGVSLPLSNKKFGKEITLFKYQEEALGKSEKFIVLKAPTGGGKTLTASLIAYQAGSIAAFAYPTNALASDQLRSMANTLRKCGIKVAIFDGLKSSFKDSDPDLIMILVTSASLDTIAKKLGVKHHGEALLKLRKEILPQNATLFLLTNPDFLFTLLKGYPRLKRYNTLLRDLVSLIKTLVIDEFHLYYGFTLANILNSIHILHKSLNKVVISSATIGPVDLLKEGYPNEVSIIDATPGEGRIIRYPTDLEITSLRAKGSLWSEDHLHHVSKLAINALDKADQKSDVKVLVLVNSAIFAEKLYQKLRDEYDVQINRIHGFIPESKREFSAEILIGTRAVDIGIDFDASVVIFEALSASDFIQRLGRGSRKRPGYAIAIIPGDYANNLERVIGTRRNFKYNELVEILQKTLPEDERYWNLIKREVGALSLFSMIFSITQSIEGGSYVEILKKTKNILSKNKFLIPRWLVVDVIDVSQNIMRRIPYIIMSISKSGMRGDILTLRAYFEEFDTWSHIDITELWKLDFEILRDSEGPYIKIYGISGKGKAPSLILHQASSELPKVLWRRNFQISFDYEDKQLIEIADNMSIILNGTLAKVTSDVKDWRFPKLPFKRGRGYSVILGPDALTQYLLEKADETNQEYYS